jgi:hypothetical protein
LSEDGRRAASNCVNGDNVGVLVFIVLTVAVFAVLGLVQKLVERL